MLDAAVIGQDPTDLLEDNPAHDAGAISRALSPPKPRNQADLPSPGISWRMAGSAVRRRLRAARVTR